MSDTYDTITTSGLCDRPVYKLVMYMSCIAAVQNRGEHIISENIGENDRMLVTMIYGLSNNYNNELRHHNIWSLVELREWVVLKCQLILGHKGQLSESCAVHLGNGTRYAYYGY